MSHKKKLPKKFAKVAKKSAKKGKPFGDKETARESKSPGEEADSLAALIDRPMGGMGSPAKKFPMMFAGKKARGGY